MAYRLPGGRSTIEVAGFQAEVSDIVAWPIYQRAIGLAAAYFAAEDPAAGLAALRRVYGLFVLEAQPSWDLVDHRGIVQPNLAGMLRLPVPLGLGIVGAWAEKFVKPEEEEREESAVDKLVPPGVLRDRLNAELRAVA